MRGFFITGCGHSGTRSAAKKFGLEHERRCTDPIAYVRAWDNPEYAVEYVTQNFKGNEQESSPFLVPFVDALLSKFDDIEVVHIIRSPIEAVYSQVNAGLYDPHNTPWNNIPLGVPEWDSLTRVERAAHWWVQTNARLRKHGLNVLKTEDLGSTKVGASEYKMVLTEEETNSIRKIVKDEAGYYSFEV